jgi:DNA-binding CsgD family transcriptional regulator
MTGTGTELTPRELQVCELIARGKSESMIGEMMYLTPGSVKNVIWTLHKKLSWLFEKGDSQRSRTAKIVRWYMINYECRDGCLRGTVPPDIIAADRDNDSGTRFLRRVPPLRKGPAKVRYKVEAWPPSPEVASASDLTEYLNANPYPGYQLLSAEREGGFFLLVWATVT